MALTNLTLDEYFRAAHRTIHEALAHWPRPLISIAASYFCCKDAAELVELAKLITPPCTENPCEIKDATLLWIDVCLDGSWSLSFHAKRRLSSDEWCWSCCRESDPVISLLSSCLEASDKGSHKYFYVPGMRVNAHLIRSIKWKMCDCSNCPACECFLWDCMMDIVKSNSHCVRAGIRQSREIFVETSYGELFTHSFEKTDDGGLLWEEQRSSPVSPYEWPTCRGVPQCSECELHYEGPYRRTFGVEWAEQSPLVPQLLSMRDPLLGTIAGDIHRFGIDAHRIGILHEGARRRIVYFEAPDGCFVARYYNTRSQHRKWVRDPPRRHDDRIRWISAVGARAGPRE
jgi:hypothetical protein